MLVAVDGVKWAIRNTRQQLSKSGLPTASLPHKENSLVVEGGLESQRGHSFETGVHLHIDIGLLHNLLAEVLVDHFLILLSHLNFVLAHEHTFNKGFFLLCSESLGQQGIAFQDE